MTEDYVTRKFPQFSHAIRTTKAKNATLRELCTDYEELCAWLAANNDTTSDSVELEHARDMKRDLEGEILKMLEENIEPTG